jgi:hypothetical protein
VRRPDALRAALAIWGPAALALLAWPLTGQGAVPPARWAGGALLAFVLPGAAATGALFFTRALSTVERVVLAPALSLAVVVLGGLLVDVLGMRLTAGTWGGLTAIATVVLAGVRYLRWFLATRDGRPVTVEAAPDEESGRFASADGRTAALKLGSLALVAVLLGGAFWIATRSSHNQPEAGYTTLSIVQEDDDNPGDGMRPVTIAVECHEDGTTRYVVQVQGTQSGMLTRLTISLDPGDVWKRDLLVPNGDKVTANLFKGTGTTPYRSVFLSGLQ